ncbi:MAG TPA: glucan 1,4-alpha-glucosidase, partial [Burkholderiales bacterium]|nr:glucan 1,4-alpha-glucosidase [Burkholderiales bacterium]
MEDTAPGQPGLNPNWSNSAKEMVGCGLGPSRLWYTLSRGIVNEVYYPRIDVPQIRDLGFLVAGGRGFWVEVKTLGSHAFSLARPGVPAAEIVHHHGRFQLRLRIAPDPERDVLLLEMKLEGDPDLRPYVMLSPRLGGTGHDNIAEASRYRGRAVLWAEQGPFGLALAAAGEEQRDALGKTSAGYVGASDGW